jgi:hypothetical protein
MKLFDEGERVFELRILALFKVVPLLLVLSLLIQCITECDGIVEFACPPCVPLEQHLFDIASDYVLLEV